VLITTSSSELCTKALDLGSQYHDLLFELLAAHGSPRNGIHRSRLGPELLGLDPGETDRTLGRSLARYRAVPGR